MKVCFKGISKFSSPKEIEALKEFVTYLQTELPLKDDVFITFKGGRDIKMTTGVRMPKHQIFVLADKRLLIDILRTVAHEWVHEYQMEVEKKEMGPDIGGKIEDEANSESGAIMKKFERDVPDSEDKLYD